MLKEQRRYADIFLGDGSMQRSTVISAPGIDILRTGRDEVFYKATETTKHGIV
jgi:hypothetical protein